MVETYRFSKYTVIVQKHFILGAPLQVQVY